MESSIPCFDGSNLMLFDDEVVEGVGGGDCWVINGF